MRDGVIPEAQAADKVETPADFLTNLGNALRERGDVDVGLADILAKHLLTVAPAAHVVAKAKDAILKLAGERAAPNPKPGTNDA